MSFMIRRTREQEIKEAMEEQKNLRCKNCGSKKIAGKFIQGENNQFIYHDYCKVCEEIV